MKKTIISIIILIIIGVVICVIFNLSNKNINTKSINKELVALEATNDGNSSVTMEATIVKVNETNLLVVNNTRPDSLYRVIINREDASNFKANQEIKIFWDGTVLTIYPAEINNADKIEIISEESSIKIPDRIIRECYSTKDNLNIVTEGFSLSKFVINITDKNELPYEYEEGYKLYREVPNENYTGVGQKIGEATETSTAGYTGTGFPYIWEELEKLADVSNEETISKSMINVNNAQKKTFEFNFEKLYGSLENGKYYFILLGDNNSIRIDFEINDNEVICEEPQILE